MVVLEAFPCKARLWSGNSSAGRRGGCRGTQHSPGTSRWGTEEMQPGSAQRCLVGGQEGRHGLRHKGLEKAGEEEKPFFPHQDNPAMELELRQVETLWPGGFVSWLGEALSILA